MFLRLLMLLILLLLVPTLVLVLVLLLLTFPLAPIPPQLALTPIVRGWDKAPGRKSEKTHRLLILVIISLLLLLFPLLTLPFLPLLALPLLFPLRIVIPLSSSIKQASQRTTKCPWKLYPPH